MAFNRIFSAFVAASCMASVALIGEAFPQELVVPETQTTAPADADSQPEVVADDDAAMRETDVADSSESTNAEPTIYKLTNFKRVFQPELPPVQQDVTAPTASSAAAHNVAASVFSNRNVTRSLLSQTRQSRAAQIGSDIVLGGESRFRATTDAGSLLGKSRSTTGLSTLKRTPIVTDPRVRGSSINQLIASGSYWFPARPDMDTLLSKIDSRIIEDMIVIKGPYSARYGPGFNFIDIELIHTPRYDGYESHGSSSLDYSSNGEQWYGRQTFWGGDENWGYRIGYGLRTGSDYKTGNGDSVLSSYKSGDIDVALGYDFSPDSSIEFNYLRLDQSDVEFPAQINDILNLHTSSYEATYVLNNQEKFDRFELEGWYNETQFNGNAQSPAKRQRIPALDQILYTGRTDARNSSTGFSASWSWLDDRGEELTVGVDLRYLKQRLNEFIHTPDPDGAGPLTPAFSSGVPDNFPITPAYSANPGLFLEATRPIGDRLTLRSGSRIDFVNTNAANTAAGAFADPAGSSDLKDLLLVDSLGRDFDLVSGFVTAEYAIDDCWKATLGGAYSMRPPTMVELYSASPFMSIMPQFGITTAFGNPGLRPEKRWQIDVGTSVDYGDVRAGANGYYAWVEDYVTLDYLLLAGGNNIPVFGWVNTDLATLAGFELFAEKDLNSWTTAFGTMSYVEGRDHTRRSNPRLPAFGDRGGLSRATGDAPAGSNTAVEALPMISPLQMRLGIRIAEPYENRWGLEFSARVVDNQDRVAVSLLEQRTPGFTTFDLRGYWRASEKLSFVAGAENLFDKNYQEHLDPRSTGDSRINQATVFQPGLNIYVGTELTY